jgi:hypothetical protein
MPTKKRGKGARSAARRSTSRTARSARRPKRRAPAARKKPVARKQAGRRAAARGAKGRASTARPKRPTAAPKARGTASAATTSRELTTLKARFQREKSAFEKRLTETVREIGQLRHHEARATQLERQMKERDDTIAQLRTQLSDLRNRQLAAAHDEEVQPSLALGSRPAHDLDEFDEDVEAEDDDELI